MDESQTYSPFRSVLLREWRRMTSRRLYFGVCIVFPLFTLFFMATIFGNGQMENIPIGIVDHDNTATSRTIVRNISAVPTFKVTKHFVNEAAARESVQKKEIYGYLSIPPQFTQHNPFLTLIITLFRLNLHPIQPPPPNLLVSIVYSSTTLSLLPFFTFH
mgnify:CR=1 FL=1